MSIQAVTLGLNFIVGLGLGLFYFGGLWLTLRQLPQTQHPFRLIGVSFLLRFGISLGIFYLILSRDRGLPSLFSLLACFLGFLLIRTIAICCLQPQKQV